MPQAPRTARTCGPRTGPGCRSCARRRRRTAGSPRECGRRAGSTWCNLVTVGCSSLPGRHRRSVTLVRLLRHGACMEFKDYYGVLGVEPSAGDAEIKTAYRRLARKYHPDVSKETGAEEKFKAVNEAYEALRDPQKRAAYDQLRARGYRPGDEVQAPPGGFGGGQGGVDFEEVFAGGGAGGGFSDFFETL